jgi:hypothetical protein
LYDILLTHEFAAKEANSNVFKALAIVKEIASGTYMLELTDSNSMHANIAAEQLRNIIIK